MKEFIFLPTKCLVKKRQFIDKPTKQ